MCSTYGASQLSLKHRCGQLQASTTALKVDSHRLEDLSLSQSRPAADGPKKRLQLQKLGTASLQRASYSVYSTYLLCTAFTFFRSS